MENPTAPPSTASGSSQRSPSSTTDPPLLREWTYSRSEIRANNNNSNRQDGTTRDSVAPPSPLLVPVAPAVVLPIEGGDDEGLRPRYPVATFVSNLVRSSMDSIAAAYAVDDNNNNSNNNTNTNNNNHSGGGSQEYYPSVRSEFTARIEHCFTESTESATLDRDYVIVDGDLVAVSHPSPNDDESDGELGHYAARRQGNRMRQRMRSIGKWIKKRASRLVMEDNKKRNKPKRRNKRQQREQHHIEDEIHDEAVEDRSNESASFPGSTREASAPRLSPGVASLPPPTEISHASYHEPAAIPIPMPMPMDHPIGSDESATAAVNAHFIGNVEQVLDSELSTLASAVAFVEEQHEKGDDPYFKKKDDVAITKQEQIDFDSMLQQARFDSTSAEEESDGTMDSSLSSTSTSSASTRNDKKRPAPQAKVDEDSKPLSKATTLDKHVWNDMLKVLLVGSGDPMEKSLLGCSLAGKSRRPKHKGLGVNVHTWTSDLKFCIWDVHSVDAGAHPATQSLFFSGHSLYILLWDLKSSISLSSSTMREVEVSPYASLTDGGYDDEDDEDEDEDNDFVKEEMLRAIDRALELDIQEKVLSWLDHIIYSGSAILPVVTISGDNALADAEVERRCKLLKRLLMKHPTFDGEGAPHLILFDSIVRVNVESGEGLPELQEMIHAIGKANGNEKVFPHIGTTVDPLIVEVNQTIRCLKKEHKVKVILLDHLMSEIKSHMHVEQVQEALHYLSNIGEILYYGNSTDEILSRYVILNRQWLLSALSCILRPDLQRHVDKFRRLWNLQCLYSGEEYNDSDVVQTLLQGTHSSCPILSAKDSAMLWQSSWFIVEAADRTAQLSGASNTMYYFLERLMVYTGILMPLTVSEVPTYFVPSLLDTAASTGVWTYKSSESWIISLCHSWLLHERTPPNIMEHVATSLLQDLYGFSHTFHGAIVKQLHNPKEFPMGTSSMHDFMETHDQQPIGRVKIHQVLCWKSCMLVKIGTVFANVGQSELRESFSEIFVALVDVQSDYCVASYQMSNTMKRLVVCGKGQVGHHGRKLWEGGYTLVLESIQESLGDPTGCRREVVCPECLAHFHPSNAATWSWDTVLAANETGNAGIRCARGHLVDTNLLCGKRIVVPPEAPPDTHVHHPPIVPVSKLFNSVVLVGLWDAEANQIRSVGSGFIVDKKLGLVVTAGHVLFDMSPGEKFGTPYFGFRSAKAIIGIIPGDGNTAVFRYFAEIVADDVAVMDACVLRITTRLEKDVDGELFGEQHELPVSNMKNEELKQLKLAKTIEYEQFVRIVGFNQGGEGVVEQGKHVNRVADYAKGNICKIFTKSGSDDSSASSLDSSSSEFARAHLTALNGRNSSHVPRAEIVVTCSTISGHSGGPCVNEEGRVVGILSRADPVDRQRCYLVPEMEIKKLVNKAKAKAAPINFPSRRSGNLHTLESLETFATL